MAAKKKPVKVIQAEGEEPVTRTVVAQSVKQIAKAMGEISSYGLNRRGIVALVHDVTKLPKMDISNVLDTLRDLDKIYGK